MLLFIKSLYSELSSGFRLLLILFSVFAFFAMLGVVSIVYPFAPFVPISYEAIPNEVCVGEPVELYVERTLVKGPYTLGTYDLTTEWVYERGQRIPAGVAEDVPLEDRGDPHSIHKSPVLRVAPEIEGEARVSSNIDIGGRMFGIFPTSQHIELITKHPVGIKDCEGGE